MSTTSATPQTAGHTAAWLGVVLAIGGVVVYLVLFMGAGRLHLPWYALVASVLGVLLVLYSLVQAHSWHFLGLFVAGFLMAAESWFLFSFTPNPPYAGPLAPGKPFPPFAAKLANGQPFTEKDLAGSQHTVLVFYRGHW